MNPERWREIERIYSSIFDLAPDRRNAFIEQACKDDESLRKDVEELLKNHAEADSFFESPAVDVLARQVAADPTLPKHEPITPLSQTGKGLKKKSLKYAPWWMYVLAAAFLIWIAVRHYAIYVAPERPGIATKIVKGDDGSIIGAQIISVAPDSAAERAGLEPGDTILASKSDGFLSPKGLLNGYYWESGRTYRLEVNRKGESRVLFLSLRRGISVRWMWIVRINADVLLLILALIIAFSRPSDLSARWGALMMAMFAGAYANAISPAGLYATLLKFPLIISWTAELLVTFLFSISNSVQTTFFAVFPRPLFQRRWIWAVIWLPSAIALPKIVLSDHLPFYSFPQWWPAWYDISLQFLAVLGFVAVPIVAVLNYRNCRDINERRRIRLVVIGYLGFWISLLPMLFAITGGPLRQYLLAHENLNFALLGLGVAFPILIAYAILRHRVFDLRVMIRLGLQYAMVRGVLLSLVPIAAIILAGDLLLHRNQPLTDILYQRGLLYALLAGGGLLLHLSRRTWLDGLDRHFFRERYNAQRVLRTVIEEIREARSFEKVAPRVIAQIEAALHPEFASFIVRQPGEGEYRIFAAKEPSPPRIAAKSKFMAMVRMLGKPVEIPQNQTGWPWDQLPQQESDYLRQSRLEWLFPICLSEGQTEALLAMGPKRSEEPYSREDQELLQAITGSLALLLEQSPAAVSEGFMECPECGTCYDSDSDSCKKEGSRLTPYPFPRFIAHRYRFEQRLGQGGMGVVYKSHDRELERNVAIKLIHPHLTASAEAAARFRQEAKAAASFAHPNIVTVYDFGVAEYQRAYIVMELLGGSTLRQELIRNQRISAQRAAGILSGVCAAVDAAHKRLILHRDLKPENIFLANSEGAEVAKILDFGVVKFLAQSIEEQTGNPTRPGMLLGTLKYMSPEEVNAEKPNASWDLWALAVVAYEMLTGVHPFAGATVSEIRIAIMNGKSTPLHVHLPEAPEPLRHFFERALALDPEGRPKSALQLLSDFKTSLQLSTAV
jgi:eukaryotic-like serine/threonine-protein kinase